MAGTEVEGYFQLGKVLSRVSAIKHKDLKYLLLFQPYFRWADEVQGNES